MDASQKKEIVLKARLKPWMDEAYVIMAYIDGKLATLQETQKKLQVDSSGVVTE